MYVVLNNRSISVNVNMCILSNEILNLTLKHCEVTLMFHIRKESSVFTSHILRVQKVTNRFESVYISRSFKKRRDVQDTL